MKRREFIASSVAAAGLGSLISKGNAEDAAGTGTREFYELRIYHLRRGPQTELFDRFYKEAAIPAFNRAGVDRVGVFSLAVGPESPAMYVLLTHKSMESVATTPARMAADEDYMKSGADFINAPAANPSYVRVDSSLMAAFAGMPKLEGSGGNRFHLFELRTYESHSKKANRKKIEMFNNGEIAIFRRAGLHPVFFGETLIGSRLPNLTYMLGSESQAAHDKGWAAFGADPDWKKLRSTPGYTDAEIVCNISNCFLRPTDYSQI